MSIVVIATIKPIPEFRDEVEKALTRLVLTSQREPGVERFALLDGADEFVIIEKWADQESVDAHVAAPLSPELADVVATKLLEAPTHHYLRPTPAGDPRLGQV